VVANLTTEMFKVRPELYPLLTTGLQRLKETLMQQLKDLGQSKPRDKADEVLLESLARLDAELTIAKDDSVSLAKGTSLGTEQLGCY